MKELAFELFYLENGNPHFQTATPVFSDSSTLEVEKGSGEEYYRRLLNAELSFMNDDYDFIMGTLLDTKVELRVTYLAYPMNIWYSLINCHFYRTDCEINTDDKIIKVKPTTTDNYENFIGGLDKEFDLIKLAPRITPVLIDKRPCLQIYAAGDNKLSCILANLWWEQDCQEERDHSILTDTYHFEKWKDVVSVSVTGTHTPSVPAFFSGSVTGQTAYPKTWTLTSGNYQCVISIHDLGVSLQYQCTIKQGGTDLFYGWFNDPVESFPRTMVLNPSSGSSATGTCIVDIDVLSVYARLICDSDSVLGVATVPLPAEDIVDYNRNYSKVCPVAEGGDLTVGINTVLSTTPTEWGIYQPGQYYTEYSLLGIKGLPVARSRWSRVSYWIPQSLALQYVEKDGRKATKLNDAYLLFDAINALLKEIAPGFTVRSSFLDYRTTALIPTTEDDGRLLITPKSNILNINYTQPAQQAPITLRQILDMLRISYRCYWQLEGQNLRIEHIEWFRRGGRYTGAPYVSADLTTRATVRNGKYWSYLTNKYKYDKAQMPCRYEFGWATQSTEPFNGRPITMLSNYVNPEVVSKYFTSFFDTDIDYLMLNPSGVSKDGFALLRAPFWEVVESPITVTGTILAPQRKLLDYATDRVAYIYVTYTHSTSGSILAIGENNQTLATIENFSGSGTEETEWELPAGTKQIDVYISGGTITLESFESDMLKVSYWNWVPDGYTDHYLQNGFLSFAFLQQYYDFDMPCRNYQIGTGADAVQKMATGIAKNKTQAVLVPNATEIDEVGVIKTGIGDGKIRKMSINLSSRMAETTLEYDTE